MSLVKHLFTLVKFFLHSFTCSFKCSNFFFFSFSFMYPVGGGLGPPQGESLCSSHSPAIINFLTFHTFSKGISNAQ